VVPVWIAAGYRVALNFARQVLAFSSRPFVRAFAHARFAAIAQEFFTEAAVLVFVFPVLDTIVQFGRAKVTWGLVLGAVGVSIFLLFLAGIIASRLLKNYS